MIKIGSIYACIAGDMRYSTALSVYANSKTIEIRLRSAMPVGGMDGPPGAGSLYFEQVLETLHRQRVGTSDAVKLVAVLRQLFKTVDSGTIAYYGLPTKRFEWTHGANKLVGLNIRLASMALLEATRADQQA